MTLQTVMIEIDSGLFPLMMKVLRQRAGLSARGLSVAAGMSPSYVAKLERGELIPALDTFADLVRNLGCSDAEVVTLVSMLASV